MLRAFVIATAITAGLHAGMSFPAAPPAPASDEAIVHVLNRIGYGPRPGEVEKVRAAGLQRFIDDQLHPERIADRSMAERLAGLTTIGMSAGQIAERIELPALEARRERKRQAVGTEPQAKDTPVREPLQQRANALVVELAQAKVLRAVYSERQLQEVLTDFWFNHFNVDARKNRERFLVTIYERETIRPHVLGRFRALLEATARDPAMLVYLDNWMSTVPNAPARARAAAANNRPRGINENYARELMELHTLGVDGGYTQKDVTEVARAFTGWTIRNPRVRGEFIFEPRLHDDREKTVLGHKIHGGGMKDGEQVLDILAAHPSTAGFISTKLARRFVSDTPPAALVDRLAARFTATRGDLREVMRTLLASPEFLAPDSFSAKTKTPFEFVASAVRATDLALTDARPLVRSLQELGMPLYQCQPPTGYKDTADAWVNTGALVARMNFAQTITSASPFGVRSVRDRSTFEASTNARTSSAKAPERRTTPFDPLIGLEVSETTRSTIARATTPQQGLALTLGSPEFQKR